MLLPFAFPRARDLGELTLTAGHVLQGRVLLPDGTPARAGTAHLYQGWERDFEFGAEGGQVAFVGVPIGSDGGFRIAASDRHALVMASVPGYARGHTPVLTVPDETRDKPLTITVAEAPVITGRVVSQSGDPIPGALLQGMFLRDATERLPLRYHATGLRASTDPQVFFRLHCPLANARSLWIRIEHEKHEALSVRFERLPEEPLELPLRPARWLVADFADAGGQAVHPEYIALRLPDDGIILFHAQGDR